MSEKVAVITGANKGIGLETGRQLGHLGYIVFLGARDIAKGQAAAEELKKEGIDARAITLDVTSPAAIKEAVAEVEKQVGHVDALINNAGVNGDGWGVATSAVTLDQWRATFETNLFGVVEVTSAFLPLVKKSPAGRIVNLSSILGSNTFHATPGSPIYDFKSPSYDASKSALNSYTIHLAYELKNTPIKVNSAHPGWVKTDLGGEGAPMEIVDGAKTSVRLATLDESGPTGGFFHMSDTLPW